MKIYIHKSHYTRKKRFDWPVDQFNFTTISAPSPLVCVSLETFICYLSVPLSCTTSDEPPKPQLTQQGIVWSFSGSTVVRLKYSFHWTELEQWVTFATKRKGKTQENLVQKSRYKRCNWINLLRASQRELHMAITALVCSFHPIMHLFSWWLRWLQNDHVPIKHVWSHSGFDSLTVMLTIIPWSY